MTQSLRPGGFLLLAGFLTAGFPVWAGEPAEIRSSDVAMNAGGLLKGTVLNAAAQPVAGVAVNVLYADKVVATSVSNDKGEFTVKGLRNGAHVIKVGAAQKAVRLWGTDTAPPAAVENIAIVVDEDAVRGQNGSGPPAIGSAGQILEANAGTLIIVAGAVAITLGTTLDSNADPVSMMTQNNGASLPASP